MFLSDGVYTYAYDAEGNRIARWKTTNSGETAPAAGDTDITLYTWDNRGRLTSVKMYSTYAELSAGTADQTVAYTYDAFNRWIGETINAGTASETKTLFVYDGNQIVMQFDKAFDGTGGDQSAAASDLSHRYLWGPAVDQLLADEQLGSGLTQSGSVVWTLADNQNTVRDLATYDAQTNTTTVVNHRVFSAYGQLLSQSDPQAADCLFAYTGRPLDQATGLQNNLNRWYEAITGRWLSQDPSGLGPDANPYRYCGNGPTGAADPAGLVVLPDLGFPSAFNDLTPSQYVEPSPGSPLSDFGQRLADYAQAEAEAQAAWAANMRELFAGLDALLRGSADESCSAPYGPSPGESPTLPGAPSMLAPLPGIPPLGSLVPDNGGEWAGCLPVCVPSPSPTCGRTRCPRRLILPRVGRACRRGRRALSPSSPSRCQMVARSPCGLAPTSRHRTC
jgi:RHS repeat-associated protein